MYTFFVLGIVPGTTIVISFQDWLQIVAVFLGLVILSWAAVRIYRFFKITNELLVPVRIRIHATQLHQRAQ